MVRRESMEMECVGVYRSLEYHGDGVGSTVQGWAGPRQKLKGDLDVFKRYRQEFLDTLKVNVP